MAIKPKKWLMDNGHIESMGRGRLSAAHKALIEQAVRDGVAIEGYSVEKAPTSTGPKPEAPKVERVAKVSSDTIVDIGEPLRPENYWNAHITVDGKKRPVGMRTVDNECGNSLTYCGCRNPRVNVDHERTAMVMFTPK